MFWYDATYILVIIGFLISLWAQIKVKTVFSKYSAISTSRAVSGREAAQAVLEAGGVQNVAFGHVNGELTDHYDPRNRTVFLSPSVAEGRSAAAVGVAAHEAGHALQYAEGYAPIKLRAAAIPVCNFASNLAMPLFLVGLLISGFAESGVFGSALMYCGILAFATAACFQLITLPVEFNASRRALAALKADGRFTEEELDGAKKVLSAAALTYVAALAVSLLQILRLLLIAGGRKRD